MCIRDRARDGEAKEEGASLVDPTPSIGEGQDESTTEDPPVPEPTPPGAEGQGEAAKKDVVHVTDSGPVGGEWQGELASDMRQVVDVTASAVDAVVG